MDILKLVSDLNELIDESEIESPSTCYFELNTIGRDKYWSIMLPIIPPITDWDFNVDETEADVLASMAKDLDIATISLNIAKKAVEDKIKEL